MSSNVLFYGEIVPLNRERHRDVRLNIGPDRFGFARGSHVIPAVVDEMVAGGPHLPIMFLPGPKFPVPVFLVGLHTNQNAMVNEQGAWVGDYVPAFVRRYPFMFGEVEGRDPVTCIDEAYVNAKATKGERLFNADGTETALLEERIRLMSEYFVAAKRNDEFAKRINELQLLRSVTIDAQFESGDSASVNGLLTIDVAKFDALPDKDFLKLRKDRFLPAIYAHFASLAGIERLRRYVDERRKSKGATKSA
ncbi:MAG TPA: SapC family protein [Micropepsaceae bacterium]|nr:SapC family protein [Micropepsaceae bacterium]